MPHYEDCIHWRICAFPCPLNIKECRHYRTEDSSDWVDTEEGWQCDNCKTIFPSKNKFCGYCGARMVHYEN